VWPAEATLDAEGAEELGEALRPHRGAAIGVHGECARLNGVTGDGLGEEVLGCAASP
jgi:hypothetical protein